MVETIPVRDTSAPHSTAVRPLYRGTQIAWYVFYVIETVLLFRFLLRLFAANPNAGFTDFIYTISYPFVFPFIYVFRTTSIASGTFEWSTVLAMIVYWVIAWGVIRLLVMGKPVTEREAHTKLESQDSV